MKQVNIIEKLVRCEVLSKARSDQDCGNTQRIC